MDITPVDGDAAIIIEEVISTPEYQRFEQFLGERGIEIGAPDVYRVHGAETQRYALQFRLDGLADNESGVLEMSMTDGAITRSMAQIDRVREDGSLGYTDCYVLTDESTITQTR